MTSLSRKLIQQTKYYVCKLPAVPLPAEGEADTSFTCGACGLVILYGAEPLLAGARVAADGEPAGLRAAEEAVGGGAGVAADGGPAGLRAAEEAMGEGAGVAADVEPAGLRAAEEAVVRGTDGVAAGGRINRGITALETETRMLAASPEEGDKSFALMSGLEGAAEALWLVTTIPSSGSLAFFCSLFSLLRSLAESLLKGTAAVVIPALATGRLAVCVVVAEA